MCPWSLNTEALPAITGGTPYKSGSKFESNLKALLYNLAQHRPQTGFNTSVYGQSPNRISGLLQCRGDTTVDQCYNCSKWVTSNVKEFCGNGPGCRVFLDLCYLRYENYSFVGQLGDNGCYINGTGNATNPSVSVSVVHMLWSKLADEAASVVNRCAFNRTVDSLSRNYIYALAQCTRDISTDDCTTCLSQTINNSLSNYPGSQSLQGLMSSCIVRYEPYPFFNSTALPQAPAEAPVHTPPKITAVPLARAEAPAHTSQINPSSKYKIPIILGAVGGFLLILFVCLFAAIFGRRYEGTEQYPVTEHFFGQWCQVIIL